MQNKCAFASDNEMFTFCNVKVVALRLIADTLFIIKQHTYKHCKISRAFFVDIKSALQAGDILFNGQSYKQICKIFTD